MDSSARPTTGVLIRTQILMPKFTNPNRSGQKMEGGGIPSPSRNGKAMTELLDEQDRIAAIRRDIAAVGLVGEDDNGLLTYLAFTSRLLSEPIHVITRGDSGSGKTTLLTKVGSLFPAEVKIQAMTFTNASLFNTDEDYFKHKIFIAGERKHSTDDATKDSGALIRQMLSERRMNRQVSSPDPDTPGKWKSETHEREGPIVYAESTTSKSIFEEDLNRMLQLHVDSSEDQTGS